MAAGDIKIYTIVENGITLEVTAIDLGGEQTSVLIKCLSGSGDVNAFWYSDGDGLVEGNVTLVKKDSSLNMNGTGEVWDGYYKLSSTGLGSEGTAKLTYMTAGETLDPFQINWDWANLDTVGIRATSVGTDGSSIKGVDGAADQTITFPTISVGNLQVTEGTDANAVLTVTLSNAYPYPITINYATGDVSAANGSDYTGTAAGSIVIPANATSATITIPIANDAVVEANETFTVNLLSAVPDVPGTDPVITYVANGATVTITDNDKVEFSLTGDSGVTEGGAASYTINLSHDLAPGVTASVDIAISFPGATPASAADFTDAFLQDLDDALPTGVTRSVNTLTFDSTFDHTAGFTFTLPTFDDAVVEGGEGYTLTLSNPVNGGASVAPTIAAGAASVSTTITDNDKVEFSLTGDSGVTEGGAASYTINLSHDLAPGVTASVDIAISFPGATPASAADFTDAFLQDLDDALPTGVTRSVNTLTFDSTFDHTAGFTFTLPTFDDAVVEGGEGYTLTLSNPVNGGASVAPTIAAGAASVSTTITDNDKVEFSLTGDSGVTEGGAASYTINLSHDLAPGVTASVDIAISFPGATPASAADFTDAFLQDLDDALPTGVTRSVNTLTFDSTFDHTAGFTFTLPTFDDAVVEGGEGYTLTLSNPVNGGASVAPTIAAGAASVSTTITDNDKVEFSLTGDSGVTEGGAASYTINLSHDLAPGVTASVDIAISFPGATPASAADFTDAFLQDLDDALPTGVTRSVNTLTFDSTFDHTAGFTFTLPTFDDAVVEGGEGYTLTLSNPVNGGASVAPTIAAGAASVSTTITDNDKVEFSLTGDSGVTEGGAASYTINLSHDLAPGVTASVDIAISFPGATPASAADFTDAFLQDLDDALPTGVTRSVNTLTFDSTFDHTAGFTFTLPTFDDAVVEGGEGYTLTLSNPVNGGASVAPTIAAGAASVSTTITDNDKVEFSLTGDSGVTEGGAASYTINLSHDLAPGVTASVDIAISFPGATPASAADFTASLATRVGLAAAATTGVSFNNLTGTLTFDSDFDHTAGFTFMLPTFDDALVEGGEGYTLTLSNPVNGGASVAPTIDATASSVSTTITDNDFAPVNQAPINLHFIPVAQNGNDLNLGSFLATDPDGDSLAYSRTLTGVTGTLGATVDSGTGALALSGSGTGTLTVAASDGSLFVQKIYTVWVGTNNNGELISFVSSINDVIADGGGQGDTIIGSARPDFLYGGSAGDILTGGGGADWFSGGNGDDTFRYVAASDSTPSAHDIIADWGSSNGNNDKIDLSAIDANTQTPLPTNEAFAYGGQTANVVANSITWYQNGGSTFIQADNDGNVANGAELFIELLGTHTLTSADFVL